MNENKEFFEKTLLQSGARSSRNVAREAEFLWQALQLAPGRRVLELGAGTGNVLAELGKRGAQVMGVEWSPKLAQHIRTTHDIDIVETDARTFRPEGARFDACYVLPGGILGSGDHESDLAVLRTAAAALRPGGLLLVAAPHVAFYMDESSFDPLSCRLTQRAGDIRHRQRVYHRAELVRMTGRAGLEPLPPRPGPLGTPQTQRSHAHVSVLARRPDTDSSGNSDSALAGTAWYQPFFQDMGPEYLDYSFTRGTEWEVDELIGRLRLEPGQRLLDVGCGVGRHALALARRGYTVHGIDLSPRMIEVATKAAEAEGLSATFEVLDARAIPASASYDAAWTVCEGAFSLLENDHENLAVLRAVAGALRPGGRFLLTALHLLRMLRDGTAVDLDWAVEHWTEAPPAHPDKLMECSNRAYLYPELAALLAEAGFEPRIPASNFCFGRALVRPLDFEIVLEGRIPETSS